MLDKKKLNIKAIIVGWLVDTVGSFTAVFYLMIVFVLFLAATKGISSEISEELRSLKPFSSISYNLIFLLFAFLGGYIAASIAKRDELKHALIVGISTLITMILLSIGYYLLSPERINDSDAIENILFLFQIPFALLGGYLRKTTRKEVREQKSKPLKKIFATVIVAIVILIIVPLLVLRHLIKDEPPPDDKDLLVTYVDIPEKENAFYYFTLAIEKLQLTEDEKQLIDNIIYGEKWNLRLVDELMQKNREGFHYLEEALTRPNFYIPEGTEASDAVKSKFYIKLGSIKAEYLFRQGKEKEAFDEALKLIKLGHKIQDSQGYLTLPHFIKGTITKDIGLKRFRIMLKDTTLAPEILSGYIEEIGQFKVYERGLAHAFKVEYKNIYKLFDDLAKQQQKDDLFVKFSYQPNKTKRMFTEAFRGLIENIPKPRSEMKLKPPERLKFEELNLSANMVGEFLYRMVYNDIILKTHDISLWRKCIEDFSVDGTQLLLTLKLYKIKTGKLPLSLNELVPEYIPKVPDDPFDGNPIRYSAEKKIIYTVSTDLKDSGGNEYDYAYRIEF